MAGRQAPRLFSAIGGQEACGGLKGCARSNKIDVLEGLGVGVGVGLDWLGSAFTRVAYTAIGHRLQQLCSWASPSQQARNDCTPRM